MCSALYFTWIIYTAVQHTTPGYGLQNGEIKRKCQGQKRRESCLLYNKLA